MANASKQNAVSASGVVRAPDGFRRIGSVDAPWFNIKPGNTLLAVLDNLYERDDVRSKTGKSQFFQLTLLEPAEVRQGKGEDVQLVMAPAGTVVSLNYTPKTKPLELHIPDIVRGAEFQVWIGCGQKKQLKNGNTMWDLDVRVNQTKLVKSEAAPDFDGGADEAAGE
jgi:hypothetical protein